jgi:hypothetical protein
MSEAVHSVYNIYRSTKTPHKNSTENAMTFLLISLKAEIMSRHEGVL